MTGKALLDDPLTPMEWRILKLLDQDLTYEQIGRRVDISPQTVRTHVRNAAGKIPGNLPQRLRLLYWYHGKPTSRPRTAN